MLKEKDKAYNKDISAVIIQTKTIYFLIKLELNV